MNTIMQNKRELSIPAPISKTEFYTLGFYLGVFASFIKMLYAYE